MNPKNSIKNTRIILLFLLTTLLVVVLVKLIPNSPQISNPVSTPIPETSKTISTVNQSITISHPADWISESRQEDISESEFGAVSDYITISPDSPEQNLPQISIFSLFEIPDSNIEALITCNHELITCQYHQFSSYKFTFITIPFLETQQQQAYATKKNNKYYFIVISNIDPAEQIPEQINNILNTIKLK